MDDSGRAEKKLATMEAAAAVAAAAAAGGREGGNTLTVHCHSPGNTSILTSSMGVAIRQSALCLIAIHSTTYMS